MLLLPHPASPSELMTARGPAARNALLEISMFIVLPPRLKSSDSRIVFQIVTYIGVTYIEQGRIIDTDGKEVPMTQLGPKMRVGLRVKELRAGLGVSQEAFAYSIEMSRTYFAEVETGKRNVSIENIERIAGGLGVSLREFFDSDLFDG